MPTYTVFPASPEADGLENVYVPSGTLCLDCPRPLDVEAARLAGATKVAALGFGVSQASKDCVANKQAAFEKWGPAVGIEFVYANDLLEFGLPNGIAPEVTAMKDAGVDFILNCIDQNSALLIEQELERQGMGDVTMVLPTGLRRHRVHHRPTPPCSKATSWRPSSVRSRPTRATRSCRRCSSTSTDSSWSTTTPCRAGSAPTSPCAASSPPGRSSTGRAWSRRPTRSPTGRPVDCSRPSTGLASTPLRPSTTPSPTARRVRCMAYLRVTGGELEVVGSPDDPVHLLRAAGRGVDRTDGDDLLREVHSRRGRTTTHHSMTELSPPTSPARSRRSSSTSRSRCSRPTHALDGMPRR